MSCQISPLSAFQSTNLNSKIDSFSRLGDRIVRTLGAPLISIEVHQDQLFENIGIACEMFTKFCGYTKEYLIFDSRLYERGVGIRLDHLFTLANSNLTTKDKLNHRTESPDTAPYLKTADTVYISTSALPAICFSNSANLSGIIGDGIKQNQILDNDLYNAVLSTFSNTPSLSTLPVSSCFISSQVNGVSNAGTTQKAQTYNNMFDYDLLDYRKVIAVTDFEEGATTGINTLFTIEQTLAQQTYFSYAMGNYGFDLISWYTVKNWLETREKVLATKRSYEFNDRTQYLRIYPEPTDAVNFYGVFPCYVERPIRDVIKEAWVYQYALALTKISVGYVRGKFGTVSVFGGQIFSQDIMTQGMQEKQKLEEQLYSNSGGLGDSDPVAFFIG